MATSDVSTGIVEHHHNHHQSEEEKRREHLDSLTADSDVRAPGIGHRIKEEVQAVVSSIYEKLCIPKKDRKPRNERGAAQFMG